MDHTLCLSASTRVSNVLKPNGVQICVKKTEGQETIKGVYKGVFENSSPPRRMHMCNKETSCVPGRCKSDETPFNHRSEEPFHGPAKGKIRDAKEGFSLRSILRHALPAKLFLLNCFYWLFVGLGANIAAVKCATVEQTVATTGVLRNT